MAKQICPFRKKCSEDCVLYRKGFRYVAKEHGEDPVPFESCAFNIIADCLEQLISRNIGLQKANEQTRNEIVNTRDFFLAALEMSQAKKELDRVVQDAIEESDVTDADN